MQFPFQSNDDPSGSDERQAPEPGEGDELHEAVQRPGFKGAEKTFGEPVYGSLEPLRQRR